jgi:hypothetical protein
LLSCDGENSLDALVVIPSDTLDSLRNKVRTQLSQKKLVFLKSNEKQLPLVDLSFKQSKISPWGYNHGSSLVVYKGKLYGCLGYAFFVYDGFEWKIAYEEDMHVIAFGRTIFSVDNCLYFAGGSAEGGGGAVWKFDGASWRRVFTTTEVNGFFSICEYNGKLYVGGMSNDYRGEVFGSSDGFNWTKIKTWTSTENQIGRSMCVYDGKLYVGGSRGIWVFDGNTWSEAYITKVEVPTLCVFNDKLFASAGNWIEGTGDLYMYDGVDWTKTLPESEHVYDMKVHMNRLYAVTAGAGFGEALGTGDFNKTHGTIWEYDGVAWRILCMLPEGIESAEVYQGKLYVATCGYGFVYEVEALSSIFAANNPIPVVWKRNNPCNYDLEIEEDDPFFLIFSEKYNPLWIANIGDGEFKSIITYGALNGFLIRNTGKMKIMIEFPPQTYLNAGLNFSFWGVISIFSYLIVFNSSLRETLEKNSKKLGHK